jgi:hypothetical protein
MRQVRRPFFRWKFHYICEFTNIYRRKEISEFGRRHRSDHIINGSRSGSYPTESGTGIYQIGRIRKTARTNERMSALGLLGPRSLLVPALWTRRRLIGRTAALCLLPYRDLRERQQTGSLRPFAEACVNARNLREAATPGDWVLTLDGRLEHVSVAPRRCVSALGSHRLRNRCHPRYRSSRKPTILGLFLVFQTFSLRFAKSAVFSLLPMTEPPAGGAKRQHG